jgi:hypothetical protein
MSRAFESAARRRVRRSHGGGDEPSALVELGKRFARFRREHPRGTRIPDDLREAALVLLREVAPADLYRSCGISFGQVMAWKEARARRAESPDIRVFSVVDEESMERPALVAPATLPELELRVGPWSVRVRLAGHGPAGRG